MANIFSGKEQIVNFLRASNGEDLFNNLNLGGEELIDEVEFFYNLCLRLELDNYLVCFKSRFSLLLADTIICNPNQIEAINRLEKLVSEFV